MVLSKNTPCYKRKLIGLLDGLLVAFLDHRDHTTVELDAERLLDAILLMLITRHVSMPGLTLVVSTEK